MSAVEWRREDRNEGMEDSVEWREGTISISLRTLSA